MGETAVWLTIWIAVLCYPAGPAGRRLAPRLSRMMWSAGAAAFVLHVVAAFHVDYGWSHGVALRETARATAELTGTAVASGLYVNYVFAALWLLDAAWWWLDAAGHRARPAWLHGALHLFMLFVVVNGAVVFVDGPLRWLGLAASLAGGAALLVSLRREPARA